MAGSVLDPHPATERTVVSDCQDIILACLRGGFVQGFDAGPPGSAPESGRVPSWAVLWEHVRAVETAAAPPEPAGWDCQTGGATKQPPYEAVPLREVLWWHPLHTHDAAHIWLRGTALRVAERLVAGGRG